MVADSAMARKPVMMAAALWPMLPAPAACPPRSCCSLLRLPERLDQRVEGT